MSLAFSASAQQAYGIMLQLWLFAFLLGALSGRSVASLVALRSPLATITILAACFALFLFRSQRLIARIMLGVCAFFWGFTHAAPPLEKSLPLARVEMSGSSSDSSGSILVSQGGAIYEAYGIQRSGILGEVRVKSTRRLFSRYQASFHSRYEASGPGPRNWGERAAFALKSTAMSALKRWPANERQWLSGILLGEKTKLSLRVRQAFLKLGIYHLLAVSGLHVSLIAEILALTLKAPLQLAYALGCINPRRWRQLSAWLATVTGALAAVYVYATGFPAAAQRSLIAWLLAQLVGIFYGYPPLPSRLLLTAVAQCLLFPVGFLSEATLLSWAAYLLVLDGGWESGPFRVQVVLSGLVTAVFGQLSIIGIFANMALIPVFSLLIAAGVWIVLLPFGPCAKFLLRCHDAFIDIVVALGSFCEKHIWLAPPPEALPVGIRIVAALLSAWTILNALRNLSISPYDSK